MYEQCKRQNWKIAALGWFIHELFLFGDIQELFVFGIWGWVGKLSVRALGAAV